VKGILKDIGNDDGQDTNSIYSRILEDGVLKDIGNRTLSRYKQHLY
jgi:hypothetical protein